MSDVTRLNGFYAAYVTGQAGVGIILFVILNGRIIGVDAGKVKFDGHIVQLANARNFKCTMIYTIPAGVPNITGAPASTSPMSLPLEFLLPESFEEGAIIRVETPLGPVNAKFEKLRDM